jgi:hypothetical protein
MARKDHPGIPLSSGPYAAVAKLTESLKSKVVGAFGYWTVVSERASILFSHTFRTPRISPLLCNEAFSFQEILLLGRENGGFHAWKITYHHCRHYYYGAHTQLLHHTSPEPLLRVGPGGPRIRFAQAPFTKNYSWCLASHATCLAFPLQIPKPLSIN